MNVSTHFHVKETDQFSRKSCSVVYNKRFKIFVNPAILTVRYLNLTYVFVLGYKDADRWLLQNVTTLQLNTRRPFQNDFFFIPPRQPKISEFCAFT